MLSGITSLVIALLATRHTFRSQEGIETYYTKLSAHYIDTYSNIFAVKSFTLSKDRVRMLDVLLDERLEKQYPVLNWWGIIISFTQVITIIITLGVITL